MSWRETHAGASAVSRAGPVHDMEQGVWDHAEGGGRSREHEEEKGHACEVDDIKGEKIAA